MAEMVIGAIATVIETISAGAIGYFTAGAIATAIFYASTLAAVVYAGQHQRRKARDAYNASLQDRLVMTALVDGPRSRVYGRVRNVDGVLFKGVRGTHSEFYTLVVALAGHEVDAIEEVWLDDAPVTLDADGWVTSAPWVKGNSASYTEELPVSPSATVTLSRDPVAGSVSVTRANGNTNPYLGPSNLMPASNSGRVVTVPGVTSGVVTVHYQSASGTPLIQIKKYLGAPGQDLSGVLAPLFPSMISPGVHRFDTGAALLVHFTFDADVFPAGAPGVSAVMRGARVFDPRTSTTAWTRNPALIARDWALYQYGGGLLAGDLLDSEFITAANDCDTSHTFVVNGVPLVDQLFACDIVCKGADDPWAQAQEIVESMAGKVGWSAGQLTVRAGVYRPPATTVDEGWFSGAAATQIVPEPPLDQAVNVYRVTFADATGGYVPKQAPELRADGYITADGGELPREITFGAVTHSHHVQHVAGVLMRDERNALSVSAACNLRAFGLRIFDVVWLNLARYGFAAKPFEVLGWQFSLQGGIALQLKETGAIIFQPDAGFSANDETPNTALPDPRFVPQAGPLTVTSGTVALTDNSVVMRTRVQWPAVAEEVVRSTGRIEVQWWLATDPLPVGDWHAQSEAGSATESIIMGLKAGWVYLFRARCVSALGAHGLWSAQVAHSVGTLNNAPTRTWVQPTDPGAAAANGDDWYDTDAGNAHFIRQGGAWVSLKDAGIAQALLAASQAQAAADGAITSFWQTTAPSSTVAREGDIWYDTDNGNAPYRYTGGAWVSARDDLTVQAMANAQDAQATADGKCTTYFSTTQPVAEAVGDLWFNQLDARLYRWSGTTWVQQDTVGSGDINTLNLALQSVTTLVTLTGTGASIVEVL